MSEKRAETAQDIGAPMREIELGGKVYRLAFSHEQIRRTELCWQTVTSASMGYYAILMQAERGVYTALYALCFGALLAAQMADGVAFGERMTAAKFDKLADYKALYAIKDALVAAAIEALGTGKPAKNG